MQKQYIEGLTLKSGKIECSDIEKIYEVIEENIPTETHLTGINNEIDFPFCSALLMSADRWTRYLAYSDAHRNLLQSEKFADSLKPFARWLAGRMIECKNYKMSDTAPLYQPIYERLFEVHAPIQHDAVKRLLKPEKDETVLEIGCASGNLSVRMAKDVKEVVGLDFSKPYIKRALKKAEKLGLKNCRFVNAEYPCKLDNDFDYTVVFSANIADKIFRNHMFPSEEVLFGSFMNHAVPDYLEYENKALEDIVKNFERNYCIQQKEEKHEKLGDYLTNVFLHMRKK